MQLWPADYENNRDAYAASQIGRQHWHQVFDKLKTWAQRCSRRNRWCRGRGRPPQLFSNQNGSVDRLENVIVLEVLNSHAKMGANSGHPLTTDEYTTAYNHVKVTWIRGLP